MKGITAKLVKVSQAIESIPKNGWNDHFRYAFAQEADILHAVRGKLAEQGLFIVTSIEGASRTGDLTEVTTKHTIIDSESGESLEFKGYGQGKDSQDKGGPKAITSAVKYAILKLFLIPTGDDPERDDPPPANGKKAGTNGNGKHPEKGNVATAEQQAEIKNLAEEVGKPVDEIMAKMKLTWPPDQPNAAKILKRLHELKKEKPANGRK